MSNDIRWVEFTRNVDGPKLMWLKEQLTNNEVPWKEEGTGPYGPRLWVDENMLTVAQGILYAEIGQIQIQPDANITWADVPNDSQLFRDMLAEPLIAKLGPKEDSVIPFQLIVFPPEDVEIIMWDVDSSNLSALGYIPIPVNDPGPYVEPQTAILYVRFKGGTVYRYLPVPLGTCEHLHHEIKRKHNGEPDASVGSLFHNAVKVKADSGDINCQKFDDDWGHWTTVPPKAQRTQAIKKKYE